MPTPDMSDPGGANQDWLNQFLTWLGNSGQGQGAPPVANAYPGASQPATRPMLGMDTGGHGVLPGGVSLRGSSAAYPYPASTAGAPSMGYPAAQSPFPAAAQPAAPRQAGYSGLFSGDNPVVQFGGFHPENISPALTHDIGVAKSLFGSGAANAAPASPSAAPPSMATGYANQMPFPQAQQPYYPNQGMPFPQDPREVGPENVGNLVPKRLGANPPGPAAATGPIDPSIIARQRMRAKPGAATAAAPVPNLGYYAPTTGVAGRGTWTPYAANDPRIYRGPLSMYGRG